MPIGKKYSNALRISGVGCLVGIAALGLSYGRIYGQNREGDPLQELLAHPESFKGTASFPIVVCWYKGQPALYIQTDASDPSVAAAQSVNLVPRLANTIGSPNGGAVDDIYTITNLKQGNVIPSAPIPSGPANSDPNYTPLWQLSKVTWNNGVTPHLLKSEEEILAARDAGQLTVQKTNVVLNCPVIYTSYGGLLPKVRLHLRDDDRDDQKDRD